MNEQSELSAARRAEIIAKVRKLAAITNPDANAFQGEMENAAKLISKLMDEYTISWGEVRAAEVSEQQAELRDAFVSMQAENFIKGIMQWHWQLAALIARVTHTRHYGSTKGKGAWMKFYGAETNARVAIGLFMEWSLIIERMGVNAYSSRFKALRAKYGRGDNLMERVPADERLTYFKPSFIQGVVDGMTAVVDRNERERSAETKYALMVVSTALTKSYNELARGFRTVHARTPRRHSEAAYNAGRKVGENIDISAKRVGAQRTEAPRVKQLAG